MIIGDVDGDGSGEIVAGSFDDGVLRDAYVYIFDGASHALEWMSPDLHGEITLEMGDLNGDGAQEIVCGTRDGYVYVFDGRSHVQEWRSEELGGYVRGVVVDDVDGDGASEIVIGDAGGDIYVFDGASKGLESHWRGKKTGWISRLDVDDIDNDGVREIAAGLMVGEPGSLPAYGVGYVYVYDGITHELERQSEELAQFTGGGGLHICDVDDDGQKEIVTGGESHVYVLGGDWP